MAGKENEHELVSIAKKQLIPATEIVFAGLTPLGKSLKETSGVIFQCARTRYPILRRVSGIIAG